MLNKEIQNFRQEAQAASWEGRQEDAFALLEKAEAIALSTDNPLDMAEVWKGRAEVWQWYENFERSLKALEQSEEITRLHGTAFDVAKACTMKIYVLGFLNRVAKAEELAQWINSQFADFLLGRAIVAFNLGKVYEHVWRFSDAMHQLEDALSFARELKNTKMEGGILHDMGVVAWRLDDLPRARQCFLQAKPILVQTDDTYTVMKVLFNLASVCVQEDKFQEALIHLEAAQEAGKQWQEVSGPAFMALDEAKVRRQLGQHDEAKRLLKQAISGFEKSGEAEGSITALIELASISKKKLFATQIQEQEPYETRSSYLQQARDKLVSLDNSILLAWIQLEEAEMFLQLARFQEGAREAQNAHDIFRAEGLRLRAAYAQVVRADCLNDADTALELYNAALTQVEGQLPLLAARCWCGIGRWEAIKDNWTVAEEAYTTAYTLVSQVRQTVYRHEHKAGLWEDKQVILDELLALLHKRPDTTELIFEWTERMKANALADMLQNHPLDPKVNSDLVALLTKRKMLRKRIDKLTNELYKPPTEPSTHPKTRELAQEQYGRELLKKSHQELRTLDEKITHRQHASVAWRTGEIDVPDLCSLSSASQVTISYYVVHGSLHALIITRGGKKRVSLECQLSEVTELWKYVQRDIGRPRHPVEKARNGLSQLWDLLLAPIEAYLRHKQHLLILPFGELYQIPFAGLYDSTSQQYAIEKWAIQFAPSATIWQKCLEQPQGRRAPLLVGYPGKEGDANYLPAVEQEINQLHAIFPSSTVLQPHQARVHNLLEEISDRNMIHLACHISYDTQTPLNSGMRLADGNWLRASDLYVMYRDLGGATVVLSGCDSGKIQPKGNELFGLMSAFLYAGARAIVAGLWEVNDKATALLMKCFYEELSRGQATVDALRAAQLTLLVDAPDPEFETSHPNYWAAFMLTGA